MMMTLILVHRVMTTIPLVMPLSRAHIMTMMMNIMKRPRNIDPPKDAYILTLG